MVKLSCKYELSDKEFFAFQKLIKEKCGIHLSDSKRLLLQHRLSGRLAEKGFSSFSEYYRYLIENKKGSDEIKYLLDRISTNKTEFFRENRHFEFMKKAILPILEQKRLLKRDFFLRIWSAGCSSGEEPYSIAMTIKEHFKNFGPSHGRILATDISITALEKARTGIYSSSDMGGIDVKRRERFFVSTQYGEELGFKVKDELRELIEFRYFNLVSSHYPFKHKFDVIFCRNVMMFLNQELKESMIRRFCDHLKVGGYFITGLAENITNIDVNLTHVKNSVYLKEPE